MNDPIAITLTPSEERLIEIQEMCLLKLKEKHNTICHLEDENGILKANLEKSKDENATLVDERDRLHNESIT